MESETGATVATEPAADGQVRPGALTVEQLARLLTAAGKRAISEATIHRHVEAGAPTLADGMNLVHYVAWLVREVCVGEE